MRQSNRALGALGLLLSAGMLLPTGPAEAQAWFATECQESFENGWQNYLPKTWKRCNLFNQELDDTDLLYYYTDLANSKYAWEDPVDQVWMDDVDLLYASTHGGAWHDRSVWAMWNQGQLADSSAMRLGDEAWQLSILATYACETLSNSDGRLITRMRPIFAGGLRMALGSHGTLWASSYTDEVGEDFADGMQKGKSLRYAWKDGNSDWYHAQDVAVTTTGADQSDCYFRRAWMNWQTFKSFFPRRRDGQIGWFCSNRWDNI